MSNPPPPAALAAGEPAPEPAGAVERAHLVVLLALLGVADDVVGLGDRLELVVLGGVAGVGVGVVGAGELAVGLLDLVLARRPSSRRGRRRSPCRPSRHACRPWCSLPHPLSLSWFQLRRQLNSVGPLAGRPPAPARRGPPARRSGSRTCAITLQVVTSTSGSSPMWERASWMVGSNTSPTARRIGQPEPRHDPLAAGRPRPGTRHRDRRAPAARSIVSRTSMIGVSAVYVAFSRIRSRSRSTRRL